MFGPRTAGSEAAAANTTCTSRRAAACCPVGASPAMSSAVQCSRSIFRTLCSKRCLVELAGERRLKMDHPRLLTALCTATSAGKHASLLTGQGRGAKPVASPLQPAVGNMGTMHIRGLFSSAATSSAAVASCDRASHGSSDASRPARVVVLFSCSSVANQVLCMMGAQVRLRDLFQVG